MKRILAIALVLLAGMPAAQAATVTVTTSQDDVDIDWTSATIDDLPGPDGLVSLSEALIATNHTSGHDTIAFAVPESDWTWQWLYPGRVVFHALTGYFWNANDTVTLDGTTQTAFTGDTYPDGWEILLYGNTLNLSGDGSTLIGFDNSSISLGGSDHRVEGNSGNMNISLFGGGGSTIRGNEGGTIKLDGSNDNRVVGNTVSRVRVWGASGNVIGGPNPEDRNRIYGYGTTNSEGLPAGSTVELFSVTNTLLENNWIGTKDGLTQGNLYSNMGIDFSGTCQGVTVRDNLISGILGHGTGPHHAGQLFGWAIYMEGDASDIDIVGNSIGLDIDGNPSLGAVYGINIGTWNAGNLAGIHIGGTAPDQGNAIAGHYLDGIRVGRTVQGVSIRGNSIQGNSGLGIDLIADNYDSGVSPNDALDADAGGNGLQNFPDIVAANFEGGGLRLQGQLHSTPNTTYQLDFFASSDCDDSGYGEGHEYLGSAVVGTNAGGDTDFNVLLSAAVEPGWVITATATREDLGATSEFSGCRPIEGEVTAAEPVGAPASARLGLPWPNPANPNVSIDLALAREGQVRLRVLDATGRAVSTLFEGIAPAGDLRLTWNGRDAEGLEAASGLYFFELSGAATATRKFTLLR